MSHTMHEDQTRDQAILIAKKRLESFQFRRATSCTPNTQTFPLKPSHGRSHSRNSSISSPLSLSTSSSSEMSSSTSSDRPSSITSTRPRPTSHHRRRSSVSTRVESAELMGVTLPELPPSSSEDNMIFGDKDSIRRRALWALEGKTDLGSSNNTVEIPVLDIPINDLKPFDFRECQNANSPQSRSQPNPAVKTSNSVPPPAFGLSNPFASKRDSFGKLLTPASSLKDQLTLIEEEEEEEEPRSEAVRSRTPQPTAVPVGDYSEDLQPLDIQADTTMTMDTPEVSLTTPSPIPIRHRPANLVLRPLSLTPVPTISGLPTPSPTPSPRINGLKNLTLAPSPETASPAYTPSRAGDERRQRSLVLTPSPSPVNVNSVRRQSLFSPVSPLAAPVLAGGNPMNKRQSSISYIRSGTSPTPPVNPAFSLPTPGATPTTEKRMSTSSIASEADSVLSANDPAFLYHSHATLLARITDLERALHSRPRSRSSSIHSDFSVAASEPSDEMLRLVADLKSERDDLMRDVEVWRQRVEDLERGKNVLERRVESERRESWMKGEKLSMLEFEKEGLGRQLKDRQAEVEIFQARMEDMSARLDKTVRERDVALHNLEDTKRQLGTALSLAEKSSQAEQEVIALRSALFEEQKCREALESQLEIAGLMDTPTPNSRDERSFSKFSHRVSPNPPARNNGLGFTSMDSEGSYTDVESADDHRMKGPFTLKAVEEEPECEDDFPEEEDGLAGYEDEADSDLSFRSGSLSSSSSFDGDLPRDNSQLRVLNSSTPQPTQRPRSACNTPPTSPSPTPCPTPVVNKKAFGDKPGGKWTFPRGNLVEFRPSREPEKVDHFFGCLEDVDDSPPLQNVKTLGDKSPFSQGLRLMDDDDDDDSMPPFIIPAQPRDDSMLLDVVIEEEEDEFEGEEYDGGVRFTFPASRLSQSESSETASVHLPPASSTMTPAPRSAVIGSSSNQAPSSPSPSTPLRPVFSFPARPNSFVTPPNNRSGPISRIPTPTRNPPHSPTPQFSTPAKQKTTTFIPAPQRKPVPTYAATTKAPVNQFSDFSKKSVLARPNTNAAEMNTNDLSRSSVTPPTQLIPAPAPFRSMPTRSEATETSHESVQQTSSPMSFSARLSTFTNLIPLPTMSWSLRHQTNAGNDETSELRMGGVRKEKKTTFVSKERQLAKLRERMAVEQHVCQRKAGVDAAFEQCSKCERGLISL